MEGFYTYFFGAVFWFGFFWYFWEFLSLSFLYFFKFFLRFRLLTLKISPLQPRILKYKNNLCFPFPVSWFVLFYCDALKILFSRHIAVSLVSVYQKSSWLWKLLKASWYDTNLAIPIIWRKKYPFKISSTWNCKTTLRIGKHIITQPFLKMPPIFERSTRSDPDTLN